jgi:hypothetical protein
MSQALIETRFPSAGDYDQLGSRLVSDILALGLDIT